jgi:DNA-binding HxlR family transcriptional regulator
MNDDAHRSGCPINLTLEVFGDKWSLLIIRDMMFGNRRHFRELLSRSEEGIASNILADRLKRLMEEGMITRADDPSHKQKAIYSLTEKAIQLVPVFAQIGAWGRRHLPVSEELSIRAELRRMAALICGLISWTSCATCISASSRRQSRR